MLILSGKVFAQEDSSSFTDDTAVIKLGVNRSTNAEYGFEAEIIMDHVFLALTIHSYESTIPKEDRVLAGTVFLGGGISKELYPFNFYTGGGLGLSGDFLALIFSDDNEEDNNDSWNKNSSKQQKKSEDYEFWLGLRAIFGMELRISETIGVYTQLNLDLLGGADITSTIKNNFRKSLTAGIAFFL